MMVMAYLAHDARVDRLDGDFLAREVKSLHQWLQFIYSKSWHGRIGMQEIYCYYEEILTQEAYYVKEYLFKKPIWS